MYGWYVLQSTTATARVGAVPATTVLSASAALVFVAATVATGPSWPHDLVGWAAVAGLALVSTVTAIIAFFAGLRRLGPSDTATLSTLEPVLAVVLAWAVFGESVGPVQAFGGVLIVLAAVLVARAGRRQPPAREPHGRLVAARARAGRAQ